MAKKVTLSDIAAEVGVSNVAVHKALSDKPGVSDELREQIKTIAAQMGYTSPASKKKEKMSINTGNIGVIVPEHYYGISVSFYGQLYEQVVKTLYKYHYFGILELLTEEDEKNRNLPKVLQDNKVDGLIFLGQMSKEYIEKMVNQTKLPVFFLDTYQASMTFDTVISDGYHGTYVLTDYLIQQGHTMIGFVGSVDATSSIADRYWGYRRALREHGIQYKDAWEIPDRDENGQTYQTVITDAAGMDAFVCNCDYTAYFVIRDLENLGYRVPEDISVVGFDNFLPMGIGMDDADITSYGVDMERMADTCVKSLIHKMSGKKYAEGIQVVAGKLVHKSTDRCRNENR